MHTKASLSFLFLLAAGSIAKPCPKPGSSGADTTVPSNNNGTSPIPKIGTLAQKPTKYCGAHRPKSNNGTQTGTFGGLKSFQQTGGTGSDIASAGNQSTPTTTSAASVATTSSAGSSPDAMIGTSTSTSADAASTTSTSSSTSSSTNGTSSAPQRGGGKCPAGFLNVVFNVNAGSLPGWSNNAIWNSLSSNGISNWIGFSLGQGYEDPSYANMTPDLAAAQIPICMNPDKVGTCVDSLTSDHPPEYMEIFNEMDYSWEGKTPTADPQTAANAAPPIFAATTPTKLISPALAYTGSSWLPQFAQSCNGCMDKVAIVAGHIYQKDPQNVMNILEQFHNQWPDKKVWLTELAPASSVEDGCTFGDAEMINYMQTLIPKIVATGYVDKIFWNNGAWVSSFPF